MMWKPVSVDRCNNRKETGQHGNSAKSGDYWICRSKNHGWKNGFFCIWISFDGVQVSLNGISVIDRGTSYDIGVNYKSNDPGLKFQWKIYNLKKQEWKLIQKPVSGQLDNMETRRSRRLLDLCGGD